METGISYRIPTVFKPQSVYFKMDSCQMHAASSLPEIRVLKSVAAYAVGVRVSCSSDLMEDLEGSPQLFAFQKDRETMPEPLFHPRSMLHMGNHM